jgi:hypothetical protein
MEPVSECRRDTLASAGWCNRVFPSVVIHRLVVGDYRESQVTQRGGTGRAVVVWSRCHRSAVAIREWHGATAILKPIA